VHNNSRFPEVNARLADADLFGDFGNRHAFLILAALGTATIDGAGNLLFLRAVRTYERAEMTTRFVSFRDVAQLAQPTICSLLLSLFNLSSVFVAAGSMMLVAGALSSRIPRRL
jgi:hypothetical protein